MADGRKTHRREGPGRTSLRGVDRAGPKAGGSERVERTHAGAERQPDPERAKAGGSSVAGRRRDTIHSPSGRAASAHTRRATWMRASWRPLLAPSPLLSPRAETFAPAATRAPGCRVDPAAHCDRLHPGAISFAADCPHASVWTVRSVLHPGCSQKRFAPAGSPGPAAAASLRKAFASEWIQKAETPLILCRNPPVTQRAPRFDPKNPTGTPRRSAR